MAVPITSKRLRQARNLRNMAVLVTEAGNFAGSQSPSCFLREIWDAMWLSGADE